MKTLILFDLDGVLLNSRRNMELAWAEVTATCGVTTPFADYFANIGRPFADILDTLGLGAQLSEIEPVFRTASMEHMHEAVFYDGVADTLVALRNKKLKLGVVTSKDALRTGAVLARLPVDFDVVRTPNTTHRGKPAPDHLLVAMADTRTDPAETLYLGDMDADFEAARRAGIDYVHTRWGYGAEPDGAVTALDAITDLPALLSS